MSRKYQLPALSTLIYSLEHHNRQSELWLNLAKGSLVELEPELLEIGPGYLGESVFPLPPWTSDQGYDLMYNFARSCEQLDNATELLKILRSRHQVFKRYRSYLKKFPELKLAWQTFKEQRFCEYLKAWYSSEFPQARHLLELLKQLSREHKWERQLGHNLAENICTCLQEEETAASLAETLLHEDFELRSRVREYAREFVALNAIKQQFRAFSLLHCFSLISVSQPTENTSFAMSCELCEDIPWLNCLEAVDPSGEIAARLYWTWQNQAQSAHILLSCSAPEYSALNLENYLLARFLEEFAPRLGLKNIHLLLNETTEQRYAETLLGQKREFKASIEELDLIRN